MIGKELKNNVDEYLFQSDGQHGLSKLLLSGNLLEITIIPWGDKNKEKSYIFRKVTLSYINTQEDSEIEFPLDIISVTAEELEGALWLFCFHCEAIEFVFKSEWPASVF